MSSLLKNFKSGPLDYYRNRASFDWKKMKIFLIGEDMIEYEDELFTELKRHPDYEKPLLNESFEETRRRALRQSFVYQNIHELSVTHLVQDIRRAPIANTVMMQLAPDSSIKYNVGHILFGNTIRTLGTERHADYIADIEDGKIFGCFCLTEIGHGSNAKGMRTTATYDKSKKQFVLSSPDFEAAKCWAGSLGQTATHAVVWAQLYLDGVKHGLHPFVVHIRDTETLRPLPGIVVGDMGEKLGLNGIDNGFLMFENYTIPRENLLNKTGDVTEDGKYVTPYKDSSKRHGASLGGLSGGRVGITNIGTAYGTQAIVIAIRYAAVRRQFGPDGGEEVPILEYQVHQHRLIPYLAAAYVSQIFSSYFLQIFYQFSLDSIFGQNQDILPDMGIEIHGVSSACKPVVGWTMRDAIQESREACGGHGYLKVAGIGNLRNDHDANLTYEGENHVLIQQTSNWLLKFWPQILNGEKIATPLQSANFLSNAQQILKNNRFTAKTIKEVSDTKHILDTYQWLTCYLLKKSHDKLEKHGGDSFWAKNDSQVFYAKNLAISFIQHFLLQRTLIKINEATDPSIKNVLTKIFSLYGVWTLEKQLATLYEGGFAHGSEPTTLIQDAILQLCKDLKDDAVALVDAVAPPDFILNSVLGASDGRVYDRLKSAMFQSPHAMTRPKWWQDIVNHQSYAKL